MIGIYQIKNLITNKVYIGSSKAVNKRMTMHRHMLNKNIHSNKHLQSAWFKYGKAAFEFKVIQILENENDLLKYEQIWMDWTKCYDDQFGYNLNRVAGSNLGYRHTEEHKAKVAALHKNKVLSDETKAKMKKSKLLAGTRKLEKWPHELGRKCNCNECRLRHNEYRKLWKRRKKLEAQNV